MSPPADSAVGGRRELLFRDLNDYRRFLERLAQFIDDLLRFAGLTQRKIAVLMGPRTGAAVSAQLKWLEDNLRRDSNLSKSIDKLDKLPRAKRNEAVQIEVKQTANRPGQEKKSAT